MFATRVVEYSGGGLVSHFEFLTYHSFYAVVFKGRRVQLYGVYLHSGFFFGFVDYIVLSACVKVTKLFDEIEGGKWKFGEMKLCL